MGIVTPRLFLKLETTPSRKVYYETSWTCWFFIDYLKRSTNMFVLQSGMTPQRGLRGMEWS